MKLAAALLLSAAAAQTDDPFVWLLALHSTARAPSTPAERDFLASISPYANLKTNVKYPLPLVWTTTKDDRVGPQHARKFSARLSAMGIPYLCYEVIEGGHGAGANLKEQAKTSALEMTYFARQLD